jgi:hypothetical protein
MRRATRTFKPMLEGLENRETPAGDVLAFFSAGNLTLVGDSDPNAVTITQVAGNLVVTGNGTTVNGGAAFTTAGPVNSVGIQLGSGADAVTFDLTASAINLAANLNIIDTVDATTVTTTIPANNVNHLNVGGNLQVIENAAASVTLANLAVTGSTGFQNLVNATNLTITTSGAGVFGILGRGLTITDTAGANTNAVTNTSVIGNVTIGNGPGGGTNLINSNLAAGTRPVITGSILISATGGNVVSKFYGIQVNGGIGINAGAARTATFLSATGAGQTIVGGNVNVLGTNSAAIDIGLADAGLANANGAFLNGNLQVTGIGGATGIGGLPAGTLNALLNNATILGSTSLTLPNNKVQTLTIQNSFFGGAFGLNSVGFSPTTLNIQTGAGATTFNSSVRINLGHNNDVLNLAATTAAASAGNVFFNQPALVNINAGGAYVADTAFVKANLVGLLPFLHGFQVTLK